MYHYLQKKKKLDEMGHLHLLLDEMGLDEMGLDEMGLDKMEMGINRMRSIPISRGARPAFHS